MSDSNRVGVVLALKEIESQRRISEKACCGRILPVAAARVRSRNA